MLKTKRLVLEEVSMSNLEEVHKLHLLPETDKYNTLGIPESIDSTKQVVAKWLSEANTTPKASYTYCIRDINTNKFIGLFGLKIGRIKYSVAEVWYQNLPEDWDKGYSTEALNEVLAFCFNTLNLHRIEAGCATENVASIKVLEKTGFTREGHARKILPIRGSWVDNYSYAILEEDFGKKLTE